jgi:hypothetical protein
MVKCRVFYPPAVSRYYHAIFNPYPEPDPRLGSVLKHLDFRRPRRGPVPGTVSRYAAADRALFDEITRLIRDGAGSATAAALQLAIAGKVAGTGIPESRAARLVKAYKAYLRQTTH